MSVVAGCLASWLMFLWTARRQYRVIQSFAQWSGAAASSSEVPPAWRGAGGKAAASVADERAMHRIAADIDVLRSRYRSLLEDRSRMVDAMASMQEGFLAFDQQLDLLLFNAAAKALLDLPPSIALGTSIYRIIPRPAMLELVNRTHLSGQTQEAVIEGGSGSRRQLRLRVTPLEIPQRTRPAEAVGSDRGVLLLVSDVTRLQQLESMRRDFTANVSHELKTPLASIQAYTETLLLGALDDPTANRHFVEQIAAGTERLSALIADLLQLARLDSEPPGRQSQSEAVDVRPILDDVIGLHTAIADAKGITLQHHRGEAARVAANTDAIRVIFGNLVGNAIRYNKPNGRVDIRYEQPPGTGMLQVTVSDTGVGIPAGEQSRIFERFYRVDRARSIDTGGTGLGLAIVKHQLQHLGGAISVRSRPGAGSHFIVRLPLADSSKLH